MARTIRDRNLNLWEAYASAGDFGFPDGARLVFHSVSDPGRRARILEREGDISDVAHEVRTLSDAELLELLDRTEELS